jgi:predicted ribosomally synthesized peptide with SipW-like signal peptide
MKHKKLIIVAIVVVAMAVAASVAYAWWSDTVSVSDNTVSTGEVSLETSGLPVVAAGLVPQVDPALDAPDAAYPGVQYFWVKNGSSIPLMFYGWLSDGNDPKNINPHVNARIWLLGSSTEVPSWWTGYPSGWVDTFQPAANGPFLSYDGALSGLWSGAPAGVNYLSSRYWTGSSWLRTPIGKGEYGVYRIAVWLDSAAPDTTQNATVSFTINFTGMQDGAWTEAGYDGTAKY